MSTPFHLVTTFATDIAHGNPAAVVLLDDGRESAWYATVATILNQPATAFLHPNGTGYALRWFSPTRELPLCGHGTLAAAHVLHEAGLRGPVALTTQSGVLDVRTAAGVTWIRLPATSLKEATPSVDLLDALGVRDVEWYGEGEDDLVVVLESVAAVESVAPDFGALAGLAQTRTTVTAAGGDGVDVTSRVFPPRVGVTEDQVTGTAHAALGPYWSRRLGRTRLSARQASQRGGLLELDLTVDGVVDLGGRAVTYAGGSLAY